MQTPVTSSLSPPTFVGTLACAWGILGFFALLIIAIGKLSLIAQTAISQGLTALQWLLLIANCGFMAYSEGYKGFQKSYSPRLAARARYLLGNASVLQMLLAPLFCMGFFNAPRRRIITSILLTFMIVIFIVAIRLLPQPWRGILDAGVVIGLAWGVIATSAFCIQAFTSDSFDIDAEVC